MLEHPKTYNTQTVIRKDKLRGLKNYRIHGQSAGKAPKSQHEIWRILRGHTSDLKCLRMIWSILYRDI